MAETGSGPASPSSPRGVTGAKYAGIGPGPRLVRCKTCHRVIDALRAERVRATEVGFFYFCCSEHALDFTPPSADALGATTSSHALGGALRPAAQVPGELLAPPHVGVDPLDELDAVDELALSPPPSSVGTRARTEAQALAVPQNGPTADEAPHRAARAATPVRETPTRREAPEGLLLSIAALSGLLCVTLALAGSGTAALTARTVVLASGAGALVAQAFLGRRGPRELDRFSQLAGPIAVLVVAIIARVTNSPVQEAALATGGLLVAALALGKLAVARASLAVDTKRAAIELALRGSAERVRGQRTQTCSAEELRPGEEVIVEAGQLVPADGTIVAGTATVRPWLEGSRRETRSAGDTIVAGAEVLEGSFRMVAGWTGLDRAWLRLTADRRRRADLRSASARSGYLIAQRGAPFAAGLAILSGFAVHADPLAIVLSAAAAHSALAGPGLAELPATQIARAVLDALRYGIAFRGATHLDTAGRVTVTALCARGTVLLGEPEVASVEPVRDLDAERVLALAAGAESAVAHPIATAVVRAARARGVRPDSSRNHNPTPGLGVTAITSDGKALVVGSRALMLREKVSVAAAERRITELEAMGRAALLIAIESRLVGIVSLQDGLRPGARAAVQHLLDVGCEPVLLSGDSRETTEAIGRTIDIEHVRPEIPAASRGDEVKRLSDGGAVVAVVGRSPIDDVALSAADVSVTLASAGTTNAEWSVGLTSDDVRDAARAIRIAHTARHEARTTLTTVLVPSGVAALAVSFALVPPFVAPLAALASTLVGTLRLRERDD